MPLNVIFRLSIDRTTHWYGTFRTDMTVIVRLCPVSSEEKNGISTKISRYHRKNGIFSGISLFRRNKQDFRKNDEIPMSHNGKMISLNVAYTTKHHSLT